MSLARAAAGAVTAIALLCSVAPGHVCASTAEYQVTFQSSWSQATHPVDFPSNAHFSGLIGGSHSDQVSFWNLGAPASTGIKDMAELGAKTPLMQEVQAAVAAGTARAVLSGGGIGVSPGSVTMTFDMDEAFPYVTLVSMLAPSPDWFVGVSGLSLRANGAWISHLVVPLVTYDAGTDSGPTYASPNQATLPPIPIAEINYGPLAANNMVGTFTFSLTNVLGTPQELPGSEARLVVLGPNPLRETSRFQILVPSGRLADLVVYGVGGQRVRELFRGETSGLARVVGWNGRDDRGTLVPAGMYFVALRGDGLRPLTRSVVVVR